jgi:hypothetical protein
MNNDTPYDEDPFKAVTDEADDVTLNVVMREYEKKFFSDMKPVTILEVGGMDDGPAKYEQVSESIRVNSTVSHYPRVALVLILHELINHKLTLQQTAPDEKALQSEVDRLWKAGAYKGLL